jgi:hypothetical protein
MNRTEFLQQPEVKGFTDWLAATLPQRQIQLNVRASKFVPGGIQETTCFADLVPHHYCWRATGLTTGDWAESCVKTGTLSADLRTAVQANDAVATLTACIAILEWGGERNALKGARPFLTALGPNICHYIAQAHQEMALDTANLCTGFQAVQIMNSMLTKVHAFYSTEGLPIYDSRVSAAAAALVEFWRRQSDTRQLPDTLCFPLAGGSQKPQHKLTCLFEQPLTPGTLLYTVQSTPQRWASAKVRLAWVMAETLRKSPALFAGQPDRMRAMEASLFMVGYDLTCLA